MTAPDASNDRGEPQVSASCAQELCENWSGDGNVCPCALFGIERPGAVDTGPNPMIRPVEYIRRIGELEEILGNARARIAELERGFPPQRSGATGWTLHGQSSSIHIENSPDTDWRGVQTFLSKVWADRGGTWEFCDCNGDESCPKRR